MIKTGKIDIDAFWERVDHLRDIMGVSVIELQERMGKTGTYLYVARYQKSLPSVELIARMADAFGCTVDYLIGHVAQTSNDPELDEVIEMWRNDPNFKLMVRPIVSTLKNR